MVIVLFLILSLMKSHSNLNLNAVYSNLLKLIHPIIITTTIIITTMIMMIMMIMIMITIILKYPLYPTLLLPLSLLHSRILNAHLHLSCHLLILPTLFTSAICPLGFLL